MALRSIRVDGDEVLRKISKPVEVFNDRLNMLIEDMFDTMYDANGVGLAAVQVGVLKQVVVIHTCDAEGNYEKGGDYVLINPEIVDAQGEILGEEGCLSIPGKAGRVFRPKQVTVNALDQNGMPYTITAQGLLCKALCHEIDHLHGILYSDKVVEWLSAESEN